MAILRLTPAAFCCTGIQGTESWAVDSGASIAENSSVGCCTVNKKVKMTKESIIELQKIDCNCNDCKFLQRLSDKLNKVVANDKILQEEIFNITKERKIKKTLSDIENLKKNQSLIRNAADKIMGKNVYLDLLRKKKFGYQGQRTQSQYGRCLKFDKEITFFPNTCQLETQGCFEHRRVV